MTDAAHHSMGPSGAHRWMRCPGSVALESKYPDSDSHYAAEGSAAHELAHLCLKDNHDAEDYLNSVIEIGDREFTVDHDMADAVQAYLDRCRELMGDGFEYSFEKRVSLDPWVPGAFGTSDFAALDVAEKRLYIKDYKHGKGTAVYAKDNEQMMLYALGQYQEWYLYDVTEIEMEIVQPRIDHVSNTHISIKDLLTWADQVLKPAVEIIMTHDNPPLIAGPKQCQWCRAKHDCIELARMVEKEVREEFAILDEEVEDRYLPHALELVDTVRAWANAVEAHAVHQLEQGTAVPGYKLVEGRSLRKWKSDAEVSDALRKLARNSKKFKVSNFFEEKMVTVAQAEKVMGKKVFQEKLGSLVLKPPGKPTLARESDRRPPVNSAEALGFSDLSETQEKK